VTGSHGLSLTPTPHELILEHRSGRIRSSSPSSGAPIQLDFHHGQPRDGLELVVFFADTDCCIPASGADDDSDCRGSGSVIDEWCPLVNFFEPAAAHAWAVEHGVRGTPVPLAEATDQGRAAWRRWIADGDQPVGPTGQAGS
jgi:hypothetical protein